MAFCSTSHWPTGLLEPTPLISHDKMLCCAVYKNTKYNAARMPEPDSLLFEWLPAWLLLKHGVGYSVFISNYWTEACANFSVTWEIQGEFRVTNTSHGLQSAVYKYSPQKKTLQGKAVKSSVTPLLVAEPLTGNAKGIAEPPCATRGFYLVQLKPGRKVMKARKWTLNLAT